MDSVAYCNHMAGYATQPHRLLQLTFIMSELPPEIWLYISGFLSDTELRDLMAVNRIFYQISLDIRYREISITGINTAIVRLLERLR